MTAHRWPKMYGKEAQLTVNRGCVAEGYVVRMGQTRLSIRIYQRGFLEYRHSALLPHDR
jgi:hypothetical protein